MGGWVGVQGKRLLAKQRARVERVESGRAKRDWTRTFDAGGYYCWLLAADYYLPDPAPASSINCLPQTSRPVG